MNKGSKMSILCTQNLDNYHERQNVQTRLGGLVKLRSPGTNAIFCLFLSFFLKLIQPAYTFIALRPHPTLNAPAVFFMHFRTSASHFSTVGGHTCSFWDCIALMFCFNICNLKMKITCCHIFFGFPGSKSAFETIKPPD